MSLSSGKIVPARPLAVPRTKQPLGPAAPFTCGPGQGSRETSRPAWNGDAHVVVLGALELRLSPRPRSPAWPYLASATGRRQPRRVRCSPPATSGPSFLLGAGWSWASPGGSSPVS